MPDRDDLNNTLIHYQANNKSSVLKWTTIIDNFLDKYKTRTSGGEYLGAQNRVACSYNTGPIGEKQVCDVPLGDFIECSSATQYRFQDASPCVFFKLSEILNWRPQPYNTSENLPHEMPEDLKQYIGVISGKPWANMVWMTCKGESPEDEENMGPIMYLPHRGFPDFYFPFTNKEGYLSPLVAVFFEKPKRGVVINIECRAWAKNIYYDHQEQRGSARFQLKVEKYC